MKSKKHYSYLIIPCCYCGEPTKSFGKYAICNSCKRDYRAVIKSYQRIEYEQLINHYKITPNARQGSDVYIDGALFNIGVKYSSIHPDDIESVHDSYYYPHLQWSRINNNKSIDGYYE